jgi:hypothetical protein
MIFVNLPVKDIVASTASAMQSRRIKPQKVEGE